MNYLWTAYSELRKMPESETTPTPSLVNLTSCRVRPINIWIIDTTVSHSVSPNIPNATLRWAKICYFYLASFPRNTLRLRYCAYVLILLKSSVWRSLETSVADPTPSPLHNGTLWTICWQYFKEDFHQRWFMPPNIITERTCWLSYLKELVRKQVFWSISKQNIWSCVFVE